MRRRGGAARSSARRARSEATCACTVRSAAAPVETNSEEDQHAAIDYLFLWYAADQRWAPLNYDQREALNAGTLTFDEKWRGPCRA